MPLIRDLSTFEGLLDVARQINGRPVVAPGLNAPRQNRRLEERQRAQPHAISKSGMVIARKRPRALRQIRSAELLIEHPRHGVHPAGRPFPELAYARAFRRHAERHFTLQPWRWLRIVDRAGITYLFLPALVHIGLGKRVALLETSRHHNPDTLKTLAHLHLPALAEAGVDAIAILVSRDAPETDLTTAFAAAKDGPATFRWRE